MNVKSYGMLSVALVASLITQPASASFWGRIKNAFNDCSYSDKERSQTTKAERESTPKLQENYSGLFSESDFDTKPWMRDFRYVIVVDKASKGLTAQTMRLYEFGQLVRTNKVSTGREGFELRRKNPSCTGAPPKSYWSQTPTGYYTPKFLSRDHKSSSWDSEMPFAVFFDIDNGLALHEVHPGYEKYLGGRASGGCVRQDKDSAQDTFERIAATEGARVPAVNLDGTPVLDEQGNVKYIERQIWKSASSGETLKFKTYSALIIVEDSSLPQEPPLSQMTQE